jgi:predicted ATPase with chaperone activity
MPKVRTTVMLDERVLRAMRAKAARTGRRNSQVVEDALRRDLGFDVLERAWARADLSEEKALRLSVEAQHATRRP